MVTEYSQGGGQSSPARFELNPNGIMIDPNANSNRLSIGGSMPGHITVNPNTNPYITHTYTTHTGVPVDVEQKIKDLEAQLLQEKGHRYTMEYQLKTLEDALQRLGEASKQAAKQLEEMAETVATLLADKERRDHMEALDDEQFRKEIEGP
jgi:chromosome segregation ATPase